MCRLHAASNVQLIAHSTASNSERQRWRRCLSGCASCTRAPSEMALRTKTADEHARRCFSFTISYLAVHVSSRAHCKHIHTYTIPTLQPPRLLPLVCRCCVQSQICSVNALINYTTDAGMRIIYVYYTTSRLHAVCECECACVRVLAFLACVCRRRRWFDGSRAQLSC